MEKNNVALTCVKQIPALFKKVIWCGNEKNLDIGGGKYNTGTEYLNRYGVQSFVFDPYNRSNEHNRMVRAEMEKADFDTVTLCNVLNVIESDFIRQEVLKEAYGALKPGGRAFISCYEKRGDGIPEITSKKTFQANRKIADYVSEVLAVFDDACLYKGYITAFKNR